MPKSNRGGWKTCSRGHKYRGAFCPTCEPGRAKREGVTATPTRRPASKSAAKRRSR